MTFSRMGKKGGKEVNTCPTDGCNLKPIHAKAMDWPLLDPDGDIGYSLSVECSEHGWQDRGNDWSADELVKAGLKKKI